MMYKVVSRFSLAVSALCLSFVSCDDRQLAGETDSPRISVSASIAPATRTVLEQLDGSAQVKLTDILPSVSYEKRIDGATVSYGSDKWTIAGEPAGGYSWLKGGSGADKASRVDHKFLAWLSKDNAGITDADLFGSALTLANGSASGEYTVTIPETVMDLSSKQFDFSYSGVVSRLAKDADFSPVNIPLNHFFSCFNVRVHNYSSNQITVTSIKLYGLTNKKSGLITYNVNDGTASVTCTAPTSGSQTWTSASPATLFSGSRTIASDKEEKLFDTHLMWPQTAAELDNAYIVIKYKVGSGSEITSDPICVKPSELTSGWDSGTRHEIELAFSDKKFKLTVNSIPWDLNEQSIDFTAGVSVKETGMLSFKTDFCTIDELNRRVYFKNGNPIHFYFTIDAPIDATWQIAKKGDWDFFEMDNLALTEYNDAAHDSNYGTIDGSQATVTLYPKNFQSGHREIQLSFSIRTNDGRELNIDDLIQGKDKPHYTFVLE